MRTTTNGWLGVRDQKNWKADSYSGSKTTGTLTSLLYEAPLNTYISKSIWNE